MFHLRDAEVEILCGLERGPRYIDAFEDVVGVNELLQDSLIEKNENGLVIRMTRLGRKTLSQYG